jgi:hypothetical protein
MSEQLLPAWLPDFNTKKIDKKTAAEMMYRSLVKHCKAYGMDPDIEVAKPQSYPNKFTHTENEMAGSNTNNIQVIWESGPFDWGVAYSLGSHPKSYRFGKNIQDWYLETHWGFDVIFCDV